jgi:hypothetical protein
MTKDIFGLETPPISIDTLLGAIAVIFPILVSLVLIGLLIMFYRGFVPSGQIRTMLTIATLVDALWLMSCNYHAVFGRNVVTDWLSRWLGNLGCCATVLVNLELLKAFLELGSSISKQHVNFIMSAFFLLYLTTSSGLYRFLPILGQIPPPHIVRYYILCEYVFVVTTNVLGTWIFIHLVQLLLGFIKSKRIRTSYTPVQARTIILIATAGSMSSWTAVVIYLTKVDRSYEGYCWANIAGGMGLWYAITVPTIFHLISRMKSIPLPLELHPQFPVEREDTLSAHSLRIMQQMEQDDQERPTLLDSPSVTPSVSQYSKVPSSIKRTPMTSRKASPMDLVNLKPMNSLRLASIPKIVVMDSPIGSTHDPKDEAL